jgi:APA family basic amino acid/polyamine antiporter
VLFLTDHGRWPGERGTLSDPPNSKGKLGLFAAVAVVLGNIVGVMIFLTPAQVGQLLPWDGWFLAAWAIGGALALLGALCLGELGAMLPEAGGDYVYIREAYGDTLSFLSGWTSVVVTFPGSIAAMAVGLCFFQGPALLGPGVQENAMYLDLGSSYYAISWAQIMGLGVIVLLTTVNHMGLALTGWFQTAITITPACLLSTAFLASFFVTPSGPEPKAVVSLAGSPWLGLFPALVPIFFAYAGWNVTTYIGGEIRDPGRNIPRSLLLGTSLAVALYLALCWVFLKGVPAAAMPGVPFVPSVALGRLFGPWSAHLVTLVIALAVLGSLNATILAGGRISYAMAGRGVAFTSLGRLSPRLGTPAVALWVQAFIAMLLVLTGRFEELVNYVVVVMLVFSSIAVLAVIVLRVRRPDLPRPYRAWGYPVTPALFVLFSMAVVVFLLGREKSRVEALGGLIIALLGLPAYALVRWRKRLASQRVNAGPS